MLSNQSSLVGFVLRGKLARAPKLIYKKYPAEKEAWLSAYPSVRHSNYRSARGLDFYGVEYCKEQMRYLPFEGLDLETKPLLEGRPHWTTTEIQAWLDNEDF